MQTGATQIAIYKEGFLAAVRVGDGKVSRQGRLAFALCGAREHDGMQPTFKVGEEDRVAKGPYRFVEVGGRAVISISPF